MAFQLLPVKSFGEFEPPKVAIRIERTSDRKYIGTDNKFSSDRKSSKLIPLTVDVDEPTVVKYDIVLDTALYTNGRYTVYYFDTDSPTPRLFDMETFDVIDGSATTQRVPTPTDIAVRLFDARVGSGTFRSVLAQIDEIHAWVKKQGS